VLKVRSGQRAGIRKPVCQQFLQFTIRSIYEQGCYDRYSLSLIGLSGRSLFRMGIKKSSQEDSGR